MRVWWCEEHGTLGSSRRCFDKIQGAPEPCRMVEKQLVSVDALVPAWIGESSVEEVSDLVWEDHAHLIDVRKMDPVWVLPRKVEIAADQVGEPG